MTAAYDDEITLVDIDYVANHTGYSIRQILWLVLNTDFPRPFPMSMAGELNWFRSAVDEWERENDEGLRWRMALPEESELELFTKGPPPISAQHAKPA